jgi:ADP-heptose:LPS heptosyltransferase
MRPVDTLSRSRVDGVRRIAVFRPSAVGDFIFALPALHALRRTYPESKIVYLGKPWHAEFLRGRPGPVDAVALVPPCPGIGAPPGIDPGPMQAFVDAMRAQTFDLAIQMYGGGGHANPLVRRFGARLTLGMKAADAEPLDRWVSYAPLQNRRLQLLEVAALVGAQGTLGGNELQVIERDRREAACAVPETLHAPLVVLQPGASDARRHWPAPRFAAVADRLAQAGAVIAVNATADEAPVAQAVIAAMRYPAIDLSGRLSLSGLCGLFERTALLVSNDTGPLHLALAVGTPAVGIYWRNNLFESAPLLQDRHRAALSTRVDCPVCGAENLVTRCEHDVSFVDDVTLDEVITLALDLFLDQRRR